MVPPVLARLGSAMQSRKPGEFTKNIDFLVNDVSARVMATRQFVLLADKIESQFAANYLSHFLLVNLLLKEGAVSLVPSS